MLDFSNKPVDVLVTRLLAANIPTKKVGDKWTVIAKDKEVAAQAVIDAYEVPVPDLTPRQFRYLLAITGLDVDLPSTLTNLRLMDIELYAQCKSQLDGGTVYFWNKSWALFSEIKPLLLQTNPELDFTEDTLKSIWMSAYANKGE